MIFTETKLKGAFIVDIEPAQDERGFFARTWCQREFQSHGLNPNLANAVYPLTASAELCEECTIRQLPVEKPSLFDVRPGQFTTSLSIFDLIRQPFINGSLLNWQRKPAGCSTYPKISPTDFRLWRITQKWLIKYQSSMIRNLREVFAGMTDFSESNGRLLIESFLPGILPTQILLDEPGFETRKRLTR